MGFSVDILFVAFHAFLLVLSLTSAFADEVKVKPGEDVLLQSRAPTEAAISLLVWSRPDLTSEGDVFFYRNDRSYEKYQHPSYRGRVELRDPEMKDGDVSVILRNVSINDTGTYKCRIISSSITISSERTSSELWHIVNLEVSDSGHTAANIWDGGKTDKVITEGENRRNVKLGVGLSFALLFICVGSVCFLMFRKRMNRSKQPSYQSTPGGAAEQPQV